MTREHKVALARCRDYAAAEVQRACTESLGHLGGMGAFVQPGHSVLIKPNLLTDRRPEEAVTTHPEIVRAVIQLVRRAGGKPLVADSPASAVRLNQVWEGTGMAALCAEESVPLVGLEKAGSIHFDVDGFSFSIARPVLDANVVISLPKVKTHVLTTLTAAVKNLFGAVPGYQKVHLHKAHPTPPDFGRLLLAVQQAAKPALHIADAVVGMDGDGPSNGNPAALGFVAAAAEATALDLTLCRILRIPPESVPYLRHAARKRRGRGDPDIVTAGERPEDLSPASFCCPNTTPARMIPGPLVRLLGPLVWIRPAVSERCVRCGRCVESCPAGALRLPAGQGRVLLTPAQCIGCCCCHEICPQRAISMAQSPLLNLVRRGKMI